jgi:acyl dehydratase
VEPTLSAAPDTSTSSRSVRFEFPIERGKILEFAWAIQSENAAFFGPDALAPPTFLMVAAEIWGYSWERPGDSPLADARVDPTRALHLEETYEFFGEPMRAGETLEGELQLLEPVPKTGRRSGPMTIYTSVTTFTRLDRSHAATGRTVIAQLLDPDHAAASAPAADMPPAAIPEGAITRRFGPLRMEDFIRYQAASGDLNPHHYDPEVRAAAGFPRFFSPGMLQAGFLGGQVADAYGAASIRRFGVRFHELVYLGDEVTCYVAPAAEVSSSESGLLGLELGCIGAHGELAVSGSAQVTI